MKKLFLISLFLLFMLPEPGWTEVHIYGALSGTLAEDTYIVDDSIYVEAGESLTIEPGAIFLFNGYYNFRIYGHLSAVGAQADTIFFQPVESIYSMRSIIFQQGSSDSSELSYCHVTGCAESAINIYYVDINISHCNITNNSASWGGGIYCSHANPTISDCNITDNICGNNGGGIYCTGSNPSISNCFVIGNLCNILPTSSSGKGGGGICANHSSSPVISECVIMGNHSLWHGGGISMNDNSHPVISRCVLAINSCDSSGGGIAMFSYCSPEIINCTIADDTTDYFGGAIYISDCSPMIKNTIMSGCIGDGGVYVDGTDSLMITYCDVDNPAIQNFTGDVPEGIGVLSTINLNGDSCDVFHNLLEDPLYFDPDEHNYQLTALSPCIDAGDPDSPFDPDNSIADIGRYFYTQVGISKSPSSGIPTRFTIYPPYPNPFNSSTTIRFELGTLSTITLAIYDISGRLINTLIDVQELKPAGYNFSWNAKDVASGMYFLSFQVDNYREYRKMVVVK